MLDWSKPEEYTIEDIKLVILSRIDFLMDRDPRNFVETQELIKLADALQILEKKED